MRKWNRLDVGLFAAFLFWCAAGLIFTLGKITPAVIDSWGLPGWLHEFVRWCLRTGDPILILLAFANSHLHAARQWTPAIARNWAAVVLIFSYAMELLGWRTGYPFGTYHYTDQFGPMALGVPLVIPLAWHVVVTNSLFVVRAAAPYLTQAWEVALAAALCTGYDFVLEPFATRVKHYWNWAGVTVPPVNYLAWFILSGGLIWLAAPTLMTRFRGDIRPWVILGMTLAIFAAGRWSAFSGQ